MIEDQLGGTESGLAWLAVFALQTTLPPTIMLAAKNDIFVASKVAEMPATKYVIKSQLTSDTLPGILDSLGVYATRDKKPNPLTSSLYARDKKYLAISLTTKGRWTTAIKLSD